MLCTFCGTENRSENKFCEMCGVKLERRKVERRTRHSAASLKCGSCGHMVEPGSAYCGMCGSRVERRVNERRASEERATAIANVQLPSPDVPEKDVPEIAVPEASQPEVPPPTPQTKIAEITPRPQAAIFRNTSPQARSSSTISGPSFLGLNDPAPESGEYLLEDEERSSGRMVGKLAIMAILVAVVGLVFVQWRSSLRASPKEPSPPKLDPAVNLRLEEQRKAEANAAAQTRTTASGEVKADEAASSDASAKDAPKDKDKTSPEPAATETRALPAATEPAADRTAATSASRKTDAKKDKAAAGLPTLAKPSATLIKAQEYLQGRGGIQQNCEQGLVYLRAAAQKNEPAAAMQMGELYATGHCVQQDRVTAYRWMNSARELAPGNQVIQTSVDQLWGRMTPQERRDAGH